ncbi:hypothetical protein [Thiosocius teredinicola]|uniref:hypothetical protein n=1 Tax=Thiosocius teredinicola TaxID=1973002 RepID=UPI002FE4AF68
MGESNATSPKQFLCMKWGSLYGADYVNTLYAMVRRHCRGDLRFVCLTDDRSGIHEAIECHPCPSVDIPAPFNNRGWRKVSLFATQLFGLTGDWLYLDLDVVVVGDLDDFFDFSPESPFVVMQNWTQAGKGIGNTSVYRFRVGHNSHLLANLLSDSATILADYRNSQTYISRNVEAMKFWPDEWCVLFKTHCVPRWPARFWQSPTLPKSARVVAFPGVPNPHQAVRGEWPAKAYKKIYKTIRPAHWIAEHWRE